MVKTVEEQMKIIKKGVDKIVNEEALMNKLERASRNNESLTIKLGLDPSAPDIHLGHAVVLRKIKQMQDLGHNAVIVIGDFTGKIGDPTGKLARDFEVMIEEEGLALRGSFVINPEGEIKAYEIHDNGIGRNAEELLRKVQAAQFVAAHGDQVCPAKWKPGEETLIPSLDLVGKL